MDNNKKPSEPLEAERQGIINYMCTHKPPWWLYWTPAIMWTLTAIVVSIMIWLKG